MIDKAMLDEERHEYNALNFGIEDDEWIKRMQERYGFHGEHPEFARSDWQYEVSNGDTHLGYWDWLTHQLAAHFDDEAEEEDENT